MSIFNLPRKEEKRLVRALTEMITGFKLYVMYREVHLDFWVEGVWL